MASLIIAGTLFITEKIRDRKEAKREKKRKAYEARYAELEEEHRRNKKEQYQRDRREEVLSSPQSDISHNMLDATRTRSQTSLRSSSSIDGPAQWVDHVAKRRSTAF